MDEVLQSYLKLAVDYDNSLANTKFCLAQLLHDQLESREGHALMAAGSMRELW